MTYFKSKFKTIIKAKHTQTISLNVIFKLYLLFKKYIFFSHFKTSKKLINFKKYLPFKKYKFENSC